jgi:glutamate carboxypeptidase
MVEDLAELVSVETPSEDLDALRGGARVLEAMSRRLVGQAPERIEVQGRPHLKWWWPAAPGARRVLLLGHYDTVWPVGTLARWPFAVDTDAGTATGPGCFDMKAGIVQTLHAVAALDDPSGVEVLLTADEEVGSFTSRALIEESARRADAAFVMEGSPRGAVKVGRKGTGMYTLRVRGRAAHAGLEPERGANALVALAHLLTEVDTIARPAVGTTVVPTLARAGSASNVVPAYAEAELDVRVGRTDEAERVDRQLRELTTSVPDTSLEISGGMHRPPMPTSASRELFTLATSAAASLGLAEVRGVSVGGASDGNFTAAVGCPTLDGLGAVGDGAHAEGEHVVVAALPERAALLWSLVEQTRVTAPPRLRP